MKRVALAIALMMGVALLFSASAQKSKEHKIIANETIADKANQHLVIHGLPYGDAQTAADVYVLYSSGNSAQKIYNPLLVVEGFFPNSLTKIGFENPIRTEVLNSIRFAFPEMDLIYVAWRDAEAPIEANSETLKLVLMWLNEEMSNNQSDQRITMIGHSMGGLIGRWTLTQMEKKEIPHGVERYISFDSPHLGANFPLGLAFGIEGASELASKKRQFVKYLPSAEVFFLNQMKGVLHAPSVEQMKLSNVLDEGTIDNSRHEEWLRKLHEAGLPRGDEGFSMQCLAISNSDKKTHSALKAPYIDAEFEGKSDIVGLFGGFWDFSTAISSGVLLNDPKAALLGVIPGHSKIKGRLYCAPGSEEGDLVTKIEVTLEKRLFYFIPVHYTVYSYERKVPKGVESFDYYPASFWPLGGVESARSENVPIFRSFKYKLSSTSGMPFIPTNSALAIEPSETNVGEMVSLFGENIYLESEPTNHNVFSGEALQWIREKMKLDVDEVPSDAA